MKAEMNFKSTIQRMEPMPSICALCTSIHRCKSEKSEIPQDNSCFVDEVKESGWETKGYPAEYIERLLTYKPFTNSKRTVRAICKNFSHVRSATYR